MKEINSMQPLLIVRDLVEERLSYSSLRKTLQSSNSLGKPKKSSMKL